MPMLRVREELGYIRSMSVPMTGRAMNSAVSRDGP